MKDILLSHHRYWILVVVIAISVFAALCALAYLITNNEFTAWAKEKDKLCWEQAGNFKISKYGVRCTNMSGGIIFNETFRPKETTK